MRSPRFWIALLSIGVVLYVAVEAIGRTSPGPLSTVHGELSGRTNCSQCHGGWFESMTEACLECHGAIGEDIEVGRGLHGAVEKERATRCALCHDEHNGLDFHPVNRQSFAAAGVPDPAEFDHDMVGFAMDGKHLELDCAECHPNAHAAPLPEGATRFIGLDQNCAACHKDVHEGRYVLSCAQCHGQEEFKKLDSTGHERHLPLIGGHGDVACTKCHVDGELHALETLGMGRRPEPRECAACHESPHREDFALRVARLEALTPGESCVVCHVAEHLSFLDERLTMTPEQHAASGFPLDVPHDVAACKDCHGTRDRYERRYPGRDADTCSACHDDAHDGQFERGPFAGQECTACHDRERFEPHAFTVEEHDRTALPLNGKHLQAECSACHKDPPKDTARVFRGTPAQCAICHGDPHDGAFDKKKPKTCGQCHTTETFSKVEDFDHLKWTDFAVVGAHATAECESCHPRSKEPDRLRRTFGRVVEHFGVYENCATCHSDPHEGLFDRRGLPRRMRGQTGCARCHEQTSFRAFPDGFNHGRWTGFRLEAAHEKAGCAACHEQLRKPGKFGRTWARAKGAACIDCHADPHAGQFERKGTTDCQRCHSAVTTFKDLTFRHNLDSRFRLGEQHSHVACNDCHKPFRHDDRMVVRYRPLGRKCSDCHDAQKDPLRKRKGKKR